jgi:hypothetical protein
MRGTRGEVLDCSSTFRGGYLKQAIGIISDPFG